MLSAVGSSYREWIDTGLLLVQTVVICIGIAWILGMPGHVIKEVYLEYRSRHSRRNG